MYLVPDIIKDKRKGIDVSKFQQTIDWPRVFRESGPESGGAWSIDFVSIRCGEALWSTPDDLWERNWKGSHDAGFQFVDAYHAFHPSADPLHQADVFSERITRAGGLDGDDSVSADVEVFDIPEGPGAAQAVHDSLVMFCERVEANLKIRECKVYTGKGFADVHGGIIKKGSPLAGRALWVASYPNVTTPSGAASVRGPVMPSAWDEWLFWQYAGTHGGAIPGIPGGEEIDHDVFRSGDRAELARYFTSLHKPWTVDQPRAESIVPDLRDALAPMPEREVK